MSDHPYKRLSEEKFWRKAIAERSAFDLKNLYIKKYEIAADDPVVTAGSCFAQHIAKRMQSSGYCYIDAEPAPFNFPEHKKEDYGYSLYSARYGNIYTARQLLQLGKRAFGEFAPVQQVIEQKGRFFDLLRPTLEPSGFGSREECDESLQSHLAAVRYLLNKASVFVFTFGLTEAWVDKRDGTVYPVCPGTAAGEYDPEKYDFKNFTYPEIIEDMKSFMALVRKVNPDVRFLFTVSPVPLVATAAKQHVLVSTVYSKSVLRAVAGDLAEGDGSVDYFPSYEIITGPQSRSAFFNPDMRTVHSKGVDCVMEHFFRQHPALGGHVAKTEVHEERDPVCDELVLEK